MEFPVAKFYGKISAAKAKTYGTQGLGKRKNYTELLEKQPRIPKPFNTRLLGPGMCWKTFFRQQEAFDFVDGTSEDLRVFAFESSTVGDVGKQGGQRRYLVTSLEQFWHHYKDLVLGQRHHYEVIRECHHCKLFFDLEYMTEFNPGRDGNEMVEVLIKYVCLWLVECFGVDVGRSNVLDLDASTASKFSRHLVFQTGVALFEDCVVAGYFVRHIFTILLQYICLKRRKMMSATTSASLSQEKAEKLVLQPSKMSRWSVGRETRGQEKCNSEPLSSPCAMKLHKATLDVLKSREGEIKASNDNFTDIAQIVPRCGGKISKDMIGNEQSCLVNLHHLKTPEISQSDRNHFSSVENRREGVLDKVVKSFPGPLHMNESDSTVQNFEEDIKCRSESLMIDNSNTCTSFWDSDCDETELSPTVERCEQGLRRNVPGSYLDIFGFDDESNETTDRKLASSLAEWEESVSLESSLSYGKFFTSFEEDIADDKELAGIVENFDKSYQTLTVKQSESRETCFDYDDCNEEELVSLLETSEEQILVGCDLPPFKTTSISTDHEKAMTLCNPTKFDPFGDQNSKTHSCGLATATSSNITLCGLDQGDLWLDDEEFIKIANQIETTLEAVQLQNKAHHTQCYPPDNSVPTYNASVTISMPETKSGSLNLVHTNSRPDIPKSEAADVLRGEGMGEAEGSVFDDGMERVCSQFSLDQLSSLLVLDKNQRQTLFSDLGVYTKNRNFRLYLSSKLGKNNPLKVSTQNLYYPPKGICKPQATYEERLFVSSLVASKNTNEQQDRQVLSFGPDWHTEKRRTRDAPRNKVENDHKLGGLCISGYTASPFPELDAFITSLVSGGERRGKIRQWRHSPEHDNIIFYITGYRWCSNIHREHKSNNIFYTVNLADRTYIQSCYDTDCRSAQRKVEQLPDSVSCRERRSSQEALMEH